VNQDGAVGLKQPKIARDKLNALVASLPPCTIGIEACSGAQHWARQFQAHGHTVRLMAPKLVTPNRMSGKRGKRGKYDAADAAAICEAVQRLSMRFVPVKPTIDRRYATQPGPSAPSYAVCEYRQVCGCATGLSTHRVGQPTAWGSNMCATRLHRRRCHDARAARHRPLSSRPAHPCPKPGRRAGAVFALA